MGTVTVAGVATTAGTDTFEMEPIAGYYQPAADVDLAWPPFTEGDEVTFAASGDSTAPAFTMTARGIVPLEVTSDTITFTDGEAVELTWTPASEPDRSVINLSVNISYHSGTKGLIACQTPDTGALELSGGMLDDLKALGVSGWPIIVFSRTSLGSSDPAVEVDLIIESSVTRDVQIPGVISCNTDADCPDGQTCQFDFQRLKARPCTQYAGCSPLRAAGPHQRSHGTAVSSDGDTAVDETCETLPKRAYWAATPRRSPCSWVHG